MIKISIDIDQCLCDFINPYQERFGKDERNITKNVSNILRYDRDFWMNLPVINRLNWQPRQYTTARVIKKQWIKDYLEKELFPKAPVYQIHGYGLSKYGKIRMGGCQLHIDDSPSVFKDLNKRGLPCLLLDTPFNKELGPIGRIYSLDKDEIEESYYHMKEIIPHFNVLCE